MSVKILDWVEPFWGLFFINWCKSKDSEFWIWCKLYLMKVWGKLLGSAEASSRQSASTMLAVTLHGQACFKNKINFPDIHLDNLVWISKCTGTKTDARPWITVNLGDAVGFLGTMKIHVLRSRSLSHRPACNPAWCTRSALELRQAGAYPTKLWQRGVGEKRWVYVSLQA